jgi:hypothetical protein
VERDAAVRNAARARVVAFATPGRRCASGASDPSFVVTVVEEQVQNESASHLVIAWLIAAFVPLLFYPHPPLSAALPALPALAILCGRVLDHLFEVPRRVAVIVNGAARVLAPIGAAAALFITLVANQLPNGGHPLPLWRRCSSSRRARRRWPDSSAARGSRPCCSRRRC